MPHENTFGYIPNVNPRTGIAYGAADGRNLPALYGDIILYGRDMSAEAATDELERAFKKSIVKVIEEYAGQSTVKAAKKTGVLDKMVGQLIEELDDVTGFLGWVLNCDEPEYAYELETSEGPVHFRTLWLGGAPLVLTTESPWVARCAPCSPCVPNAGDLDAPSDDGMLAYCPPPECLDEEWKGAKPILLRELDETANASVSESP